MKPHIVSNEGKCSTCEGVVKDNEILECYKCKSYFHAICDNDTPFANKSFVQTFNTNRAKKKNFFFMCDSCLCAGQIVLPPSPPRAAPGSKQKME